ncbi:17732_t:CDS:2, partial [Gigaspora rosea]
RPRKSRKKLVDNIEEQELDQFVIPARSKRQKKRPHDLQQAILKNWANGIAQITWDGSLHFGPFCYNWWLPQPIDKANKIIPFYPNCLSFKTLVILNEHEFITEVVQFNSIFGLCPRYICKCSEVQSKICESATIAIFTFEFWSRFTTPNSNKSSLSILYNLGFVIPTPSYSTNTFWSSFHKSLNINKCGVDRRRQVLLIIANDFNYEHSHIYGSGGLVTEKPIIRHKKMSAEKNSQLQSFLMDKANVIMSSYKTDPLTNEP